MKKLMICIILVLFIPLIAYSEPKIGRESPDFVSTSLDGKLHRLKQYRGKTVVLEWFNFECPYVQQLYQSRTVQRLKKHHLENGGVWLSISSESPRRLGFFWKRKLRKKIKEYDLMNSVLLIDKKGVVGRQYHVPVSPYIVIIDKEGIVRYMGAFDSQDQLTYKPKELNRNYVDEALTALLAESKVIKEKTKPHGCNIRYH